MRATLAGLIIGTAMLVGCDQSKDTKDANAPMHDNGPAMEPGSKTSKPPSSMPQTGSPGGGSAPTGGGGSGAGGNP